MRLCWWPSIMAAVLVGGAAWPLTAEEPAYVAARTARADAIVGYQAEGRTPTPNAAPSTSPGENSLSAEDPGLPLTLADLESLALQHHPSLVQSRMAVQAAEGRLVQAGLYPNPVAGYSADEMGDQGTAGKQGGFILQEIVTGKKRRLDRSIASHAIEEAVSDCRAQQGRVLNDVRIAFYDVLLAQRIVELDEQLVRVGEEGVKAAEQLFKAKEVSRVDVLEAQIEADRARLKLHGGRNHHWAAWRRLVIAVGLPDMLPRALTGDVDKDLPDLTWHEALAQILAQSPELARARAALERAKCVVAREYAQRIPNVEVRAGVQHDNAVNQTLTNLEVGLPLPIFNRNQGNISRAQAELVAAQSEIQRVELELHERLVAAFQRYADARHYVDAYSNSILPNAKSSLDLVTSGYRQGELSYLALLTTQRTYANVNLAYLESLRELRENSVAIEGLLLRGALHEPNTPSADAASVQGPLSIGLKD